MHESQALRRFAFQLAGLGAFTGVLVASVAILVRTPAPRGVTAAPGTSLAPGPGVHPLSVEVVARDLRAPWGLVFLPDGRALVTERPGQVRLIGLDRTVAPEPAFVLKDVLADTKLGLMGIALDPDFASEPYVYLAYGYRDGDRKAVRVARYRWTGSTLVEPQTLLEGIPAQFNHSGGRLRFGPDKSLYITTGDADTPPIAQDLGSLGGKILRIHRDGSVPKDNPFVNREGARPEVYSYGHRNPQGLDFQPATRRLLSTEHGPNGGDEVNWVEAGANYGWPTHSHNRSGEGMQGPLVQFTPSIAPASGVFYDHDLFKELRGDYLAGCLRGEALLRVELDREGKVTKSERWLYARYGRIRDVAVAPDGAIWLTTSMFDPPEANGANGFDQVLRITPAAPAGQAGGLVIWDRAVGLPPELPLGDTPEERYAALCASCHGADLRGGLHPALVGRPWTTAKSEEELFRLIAGGVPDRGMPGARPLIHDEGCRALSQWLWEQYREGRP